MKSELSSSEQAALERLRENNGSILVSCIPDRNERGVFGEVIPGIAAYQKLVKKGLAFFTEEEPIQLEDGSWFEFTPSVELVE